MWQILDRPATSNCYPGNNKFSIEGEKPLKAIWSTSREITKKVWEAIRPPRGSSIRRFDVSWDGEIESVDWGIRLFHSRCASQCQIINLRFIRKSQESLTWVFVFFEDAIRMSDISKSVQMRLMRQKSGLILQTQSKVEYDKSLKKPSSDMKLRVNKSVILEMKWVKVRNIMEAHQRSTVPPLKLMGLQLNCRWRQNHQVEMKCFAAQARVIATQIMTIKVLSGLGLLDWLFFWKRLAINNTTPIITHLWLDKLVVMQTIIPWTMS